MLNNMQTRGAAAIWLLIALGTPLTAAPLQTPTPERLRAFSAPGSYDSALNAYEEGYSHYRYGNFNKAEDSFIEALRQEPNLLKAHYWLGKLYHEQGRLEDAIFHWEEVERLNKLIKNRRDALKVQNNEYPAYTQMLRVSQKTKEAREAFERGLNLLDKGHWDGAEVEIRTAVDLYPGNHKYLVQLARILWDKGEHQASIKFYRDLISKRDVGIEHFKEGIERMLQVDMGYVALPLIAEQRHRFAAEPEFAALAEKFVISSNHEVSAPGKVVKRLNGQVIINMGLEEGLNLSDEYSLDLRAFNAGEPLLDPDDGKQIGRAPDRPSADLLLTKVYKNTSWALIRREFGPGVKAGDLIEFKKTFR
ncbi:MAG TPA: tetratricopeptide repeat protein [Candidatus Rifleibacterium sp.]|mgnify:CR=1 FL=1|nr:tetratricopeptide repeat protein [Candidatus Rifleibacterium sp.]